MSNFDEQMRLFEASVGGAAHASARPHFMGRPPSFMPSSVRSGMPRGQIPPPPSYPRPQYMHPTTAMPGVTPLSKTVAAAPKKEYSAAPQISKTPVNQKDDDDDIMATLMKYEKEVKTDKKRKPDDSKPSEVGSAPKMMKPSQVIQPVKPTVKSGTQVTADEIKRKAKQMVESVKASQVTQVKKVPAQAGNSKGDKPGKKAKKMIRMAGGQMWEDPSLLTWDNNDFRLFCGDLGNDVTDEVLTRTFSKFTSFQQAKVVRDKRSNKTKGYGFVSFRDPADFTKAIKEMDGKYVGSRPIKLRKSNWKDRNIEQVKGKQTQKQKMGYKQ